MFLIIIYVPFLLNRFLPFGKTILLLIFSFQVQHFFPLSTISFSLKTVTLTFPNLKKIKWKLPLRLLYLFLASTASSRLYSSNVFLVHYLVKHLITLFCTGMLKDSVSSFSLYGFLSIAIDIFVLSHTFQIDISIGFQISLCIEISSF